MTLPDTRLRPAYWQRRIDESLKRRDKVLRAYHRYSRWLSGDMSDVAGMLEHTFGVDAERTVESNMLSLVTRSALSQLMYRAPRALVKPVELFSPTQTEELGGMKSSPLELLQADQDDGGSESTRNIVPQMETGLLNDWIEETDMFTWGRQVLLDALLGPDMTVKVGYSVDTGVDPVEIETERQKAQAKMQLLLLGRRYTVRESMIHPVWIEALQALKKEIHRGSIPDLPLQVAAWVDKAIEKHVEYEAQGLGRPTEVIRRDHIFGRRVPPQCFLDDGYADDPTGREWVGESFVMREEDVLSHPDFDEAAKGEIGSGRAGGATPWAVNENRDPYYEFDDSDRRVMLYEIIDLVKNRVLVFARGASRLLQEKPYKLRSIFPSGPYVTASFLRDPTTGQGIPPPMAYEAHQIALTLTDSIITETGLRGLPQTAVRADSIDGPELEALQNGRYVKRYIPLKNLMPGQKVSDVVMPIPQAEVSNGTLQARAMHMSHIERLSGEGSAKLAGGDNSATATASAIIGESTSNLSEDRAAVMDQFFSRVLRYVLRLIRMFYNAPRVAEIVGDVAFEHWPEKRSARDIVNDKGVEVVAGSSRRKNDAVERKTLLDTLGVVLQIPTLPPHASIELVRRVLEAQGITGIDLSGMDPYLGQNDIAERVERRPGESQEASRAAQVQAVNNPGAGRAGSVRAGVSDVRRRSAAAALQRNGRGS